MEKTPTAGELGQGSEERGLAGDVQVASKEQSQEVDQKVCCFPSQPLSLLQDSNPRPGPTAQRGCDEETYRS